MNKAAIFTCLTFFALLLSACSKDEENKSAPVGGTIAFTLDGVTSTFATVVVEQQPSQYQNPENLIITATNGISADSASLQVNEGRVGINMSSYYAFLLGDNIYYISDYDWQSNVTENADAHVKGTFSGTVYEAHDYTVHTLTNGTFDVTYIDN